MDFVAILYVLIAFVIISMILAILINSFWHNSEPEVVYQHKKKRNSLTSDRDLNFDFEEYRFNDDDLDDDDLDDDGIDDDSYDDDSTDDDFDYDFNDDNKVKLPRISREYFIECKNMCNRITLFLKDLNSNVDFTRFINVNVDGIEVLDEFPKCQNYDNRLLSMYAMDLTNCIMQLGNNFERPTRENLCLMLWISEIIHGELLVNYSQLKPFWKAFATDSSDILSAFPEIRDKNMPPHDFYVYKLLNSFEDYNTAESYKDLLYNFSMLVAKANRNSDDLEQDFLYGFNDEANFPKLSVRANSFNSEHSDNTSSSPKNLNSIELDSNPYKSLEQLIGLGKVKDEVNRLANFIRIQKLRCSEGLSTPTISYHCIFTGNPGTGKTTVARILAAIYKDLGVIKGTNLVETDRSGLVAEYVGQTAVKTNKIIDSALDGILFIDEAYTLSKGGSNDFGTEAIATLLKRMEDDRDRLVVILAGYENEMENFILSNPGLKSRFSRSIHFDDYSEDELFNIFESYIRRHDYDLTQEAKIKLQKKIHKDVSQKDEKFGNARHMRNLFEHTLENQATRLSKSGTISIEDLRRIDASDLPE